MRLFWGIQQKGIFYIILLIPVILTASAVFHRADGSKLLVDPSLKSAILNAKPAHIRETDVTNTAGSGIIGELAEFVPHPPSPNSNEAHIKGQSDDAPVTVNFTAGASVNDDLRMGLKQPASTIHLNKFNLGSPQYRFWTWRNRRQPLRPRHWQNIYTSPTRFYEVPRLKDQVVQIAGGNVPENIAVARETKWHYNSGGYIVDAPRTSILNEHPLGKLVRYGASPRSLIHSDTHNQQAVNQVVFGSPAPSPPVAQRPSKQKIPFFVGHTLVNRSLK